MSRQIQLLVHFIKIVSKVYHATLWINILIKQIDIHYIYIYRKKLSKFVVPKTHPLLCQGMQLMSINSFSYTIIVFILLNLDTQLPREHNY